MAAAEQTARSTDKGHGRVEVRSLRTTTALNDYLDWPGVAQVYWLRRERTVGGVTTTEDAFGITSLGRDRADAGRLLALIRDHWGIENGSHYVRDVTLGEDACRVRRGHAATVLAGVRTAALSLLRASGVTQIATATRDYLFHPGHAIRLLFSSP